MHTLIRHIYFIAIGRLIAAGTGLLAGLTLCLGSTASAQGLRTDNISYSAGLSQLTVNAIAQDTQGFIWFGTLDGLNRYDGYEFTVYKPNEDNSDHSLTSGAITSLLVDTQGLLWVGTLSGLNVYDRHTARFNAYRHDPANPNSLSHDQVNVLLQNSAGQLWIATAHGLNRLDMATGQFTRFLHERSPSDEPIYALFEDSQRVLWAGSERGAFRYDAQAQQFIHVLTQHAVNAIAEDAQGYLWFGTESEGVLVYDKEAKKLIAQYRHQPGKAGSLSANRIRVLYKDSKAQLWVGTNGGGLNKWDEEEKRFIDYFSQSGGGGGLEANHIRALYEDNNGLFWVGTYSRGVSKLDLTRFASTLVSSKATPDNPYPQTDLRAFLVDDTGALWTGSGSDGLRVKHPDGRIEVFRHAPNNPDSLSANEVYAIFQDRDGSIWVGTDNGWLNRYERKTRTFKRYSSQPTTAHGLRHGKVRALLQDRNGVMWVGIDAGGLHTFSPADGSFKHYHHDVNDSQSLSDNKVFALHEDRQGNLWIATFGGGLNKFEPKTQTFLRYMHDAEAAASISHNYVIALHEDTKENVLWLGSYGGGFDRFDLKRQSVINYSEKDGLPNNGVYGILQDKQGYLWITTNGGLCRFDPDSKTFKNYDERDGLQGREFNGGAYYRAPDGKFYVGGPYGYNAFYPEKVSGNIHKPDVYITELQLFNTPIAIDQAYDGRVLLPRPLSEMDSIELSYKHSVFSFKFAALDYVMPAKNQYAYKMEGLEEQWNYVGNRRYATYTTLPPGGYIFRVKASNNEGVWNEEGAALNIFITPPFWQTWWFRLLMASGVLALIFTVYTLRVKSIKSRNKMLKSAVKARTNELEKQTHDLETALDELRKTKDAFEESSQIATGVLHNVGNLLNSVNTSASVVQDLVFKSVSNRFAKANEVLRANMDNIENFISQDPKGKKLLNYYLELEKPMQDERSEIQENIKRLAQKILAVKEAISAQQRSAKGQGYTEVLSLQALVEETLMLQAGSTLGQEVNIQTIFEGVPPIKVEKAKLVQIILNLYKNAKESMYEAKSADKTLRVEVSRDEQHAYIKVSDTGLGIAHDKLHAIFTYGFTTKTEGHGFGLHSSVNYMQAMGGKMWAESEGGGKGATFILQFPLAAEQVQGVPMKQVANL